MASKRRIRRRSCEGKIRYTVFEEAIRVAVRMSSQLHEEYHVYRCIFCKGLGKRVYHIGRMPVKQKKLRAERVGLS
jgi:hypothetical protein